MQRKGSAIWRGSLKNGKGEFSTENDLDAKTFQTFADDAKNNCPVSKVLKTDISLEVDFHTPLRASLSH